MTEHSDPGDPSDPGGDEELVAVLYDQLRGVAAREIQRVGPQTVIDPTSLVHDVWIRLSESEKGWKDRSHFLSLAATAMRNFLIDSARKRGVRPRREVPAGSSELNQFLEAATLRTADDFDPVDLEKALRDFEEIDPEAARLVELRYFGGASAEEAAQLVGVASRTADRRYDYARRWLKRRLRPDGKS